MYTKNNIYKRYLNSDPDERLSQRLPDVTKKYTLKMIGRAINCCSKWDNFLDIGASTGHYSAPLLKIFKSGVAIEPATNIKLSELAQKNRNLTIHNEYLEQVSLKDNFDFILLADIFEHFPIENINQILAKLSKAQEPGGIIYLLTPNPIFCGPASESEIYYLKNNSGPHGHQKHYFKDELVRIFAQYNYEPIFYGYEEGILRNFFKKYIFGLSIRDRRYCKNKIYNVLGIAIFLPTRLLFKIIELIVFYNEKKNRHNEIDSISLSLTLRKI